MKDPETGLDMTPEQEHDAALKRHEEQKAATAARKAVAEEIDAAHVDLEKAKQGVLDAHAVIDKLIQKMNNLPAGLPE